MVDTEVPVTWALVEVGLAFEDGAGNVELGDGGVRQVVVLIGRQERERTTLHLWAMRSPTEPKTKTQN